MKIKKLILLVCVIFFGSATLFAQVTTDTNNKIFTLVQQQPTFPGSQDALVKWLGENTNYPEEAKKQNIQGTVWVTFVVEKDGAVSGVRLLKGVNNFLDNEALRVIASMPKWAPGWQNGHTVRVQYRVPLKFALKDKSTATQEVSALKSVKIGPQDWESENLNVTTFLNGDTIPEAESAKEWKKAGDEGKPAWCYYNGDPANGNKYGKLYNWYAVHDNRELAPKGWHIPNDYEWNSLVNHLGGYDAAGNMMKSVLSALPAGYRAHFDTLSGRLGNFCAFWLSAENDNSSAFSGTLIFNSLQVNRSIMYKDCGLSCRCIRD